jgi:hypothetical protein
VLFVIVVVVEIARERCKGPEIVDVEVGNQSMQPAVLAASHLHAQVCAVNVFAAAGTPYDDAMLITGCLLVLALRIGNNASGMLVKSLFMGERK